LDEEAMMVVVEALYGGVSLGERQATRRNRLVDASLHLLDTTGESALTVRRVCKQAGLNHRYFYESFEDLDALLDAMIDRVEHQVISRINALTARPSASPQQPLRAAMEIVVDAWTDDPRLLRIAHVSGNAALGRRREAFLLRSAARLRPFLLTVADPHGDTRVDHRMAETAAYLLLGGWTDALWAWTHGDLSISRTELVDHLTALFAGVAHTLTIA
jgi:AcrR family transcriptional regulator